ncbi:hypothetical protein [Lacinutrix sp. MEBiC02404]
MSGQSHKHIDLNKENLDPRTILGWRESEYIEDLFFDHNIYSEIKKSISVNPITIIIGNPLSGKTRIVYDYLKKDRNSNLIIPVKNKNIAEYNIPKTLKNVIVFLDDVDEYCYDNNDSLNLLLSNIVLQNSFSKNIKCVITCRRGPEYDKFQNKLDRNLFYKIVENRFHIPRFNSQDKDVSDFLELNKDKFKTNPKNFDGNFGSVVLPLDAMRERFEGLKKRDKYKELAVLLGLKLHFHFLNFEATKREFLDLNIKKFTEKYINEELSPYEWEATLNTLVSDDTSLNFIEIKSNIVIEEAYLDFLKDKNFNSIDVIHPKFNLTRLDSLFNKLYTLDEKRTWGFPTSVYDYNMAIKKIDSIQDALEIYNKMTEFLSPDNYTYSYLFKKTTDLDILKRLYLEMKRSVKSVGNTPRNIFAGQIDDFSTFLSTFIEVDPKVLGSINGQSNRLLKLALKDKAKSLEFLFKSKKTNEIFINPVFNKICRVCCESELEFSKYIKPVLNTIENLDTNLQLNIIKICSKFDKDITIKLLDKYISNISFDFFNEKGNALSSSEPLESLNLFIKAIEVSNNKINKTIASINYSKLVYNEELSEYLEDAIKLSSVVIKPEEQIHPSKYLRHIFVLLTIWKSSVNELITNLENIFSREDINKKIIFDIYTEIKDEIKKEIIKKEYFSQE